MKQNRLHSFGSGILNSTSRCRIDEVQYHPNQTDNERGHEPPERAFFVDALPKEGDQVDCGDFKCEIGRNLLDVVEELSILTVLHHGNPYYTHHDENQDENPEQE